MNFLSEIFPRDITCIVDEYLHRKWYKLTGNMVDVGGGYLGILEKYAIATITTPTGTAHHFNPPISLRFKGMMLNPKRHIKCNGSTVIVNYVDKISIYCLEEKTWIHHDNDNYQNSIIILNDGKYLISPIDSLYSYPKISAWNDKGHLYDLPEKIDLIQAYAQVGKHFCFVYDKGIACFDIQDGRLKHIMLYTMKISLCSFQQYLMISIRREDRSYNVIIYDVDNMEVKYTKIVDNAKYQSYRFKEYNSQILTIRQSNEYLNIHHEYNIQLGIKAVPFFTWVKKKKILQIGDTALFQMKCCETFQNGEICIVDSSHVYVLYPLRPSNVEKTELLKNSSRFIILSMAGKMIHIRFRSNGIMHHWFSY